MFGIWCEGRSIFHFMRSIAHQKQERAIDLYGRRAIAIRRIIAVFGICCERRSLLMREGRSISVQSSQWKGGY
ncbi:hypothetical protein QUB37_19130 [Microcoleus sp. AT3-A2]